MTDLLNAALGYHERGWRVIALHRVGPDGRTCSCRAGANCTSAGKHPKNNEWQKAPAMSAPDIYATWDVERAPNLGIATGSTSGFWVLDIDPKGGGLESMAALVEAHGALPATFVTQTGSGGYHYFFSLPDFVVRNDQSGHVAPGVDIRGEGGQIVAPPSRSGKGDYVVVTDLPVAPAPQWLLDAIYKPERPATPVVTAEDLPKPEDLDEATWRRLSAYAQKVIDLELKRLDELHPDVWAQNGSKPWNHTTFEVSCTLLELANSPWCAYSPGQAERDVLARAPRDSDGFDDWVVRKTFESARQRIGDKARPMPEDRAPTTAPTPAGEMPAIFGGKDVIGANPTEGGGAEAAPAAATPGTRPGHLRFFGGPRGDSPLTAEMAKGVLELGPVGYGHDRGFWSYADGVWSPDEHLLEDRLTGLLGDHWRTAHATNARDHVRKAAQEITGDPLEDFINFRNGMLAWRSTDVLIPHDPDFASTIQLACDWDPEAACPSFDAWLESTLSADFIRLAWEMIGYLMMSGNPKQRAFLLYGKGGSGKSTLLRLITHLLGEENVAAETLEDLADNRFRTASLFGKIANIAGDIDATYQESTATFKRITGEDPVTAEHKGQKPFRFVNWAVPVFSANKIPGSSDVTEGYLRRWEILRFTKAVPAEARVDALERSFYPELPGIAAKGVRALREMMDRGDFYHEGEVAKGLDEFATAIDQVRQWIAAGETQAGPHIETPLRQLYSAYSIWAERSGQRKVREAEFSHRLDAIGYTAIEIAGSIYHQGISVPTHPVTVTAEGFFG